MFKTATIEMKIKYIGGANALLEIAGFRFLTDPTFDPELMKGFCKCEQ